MNIAATAQGFTAFAAFGIRWGNPVGAPKATGGEQPKPRPSEQIIDVEARPVETSVLEDRAAGDRPASRMLPTADAAAQAAPRVATYAPPGRSGQSPRLLYSTQPRGQYVDSWA